MANRRKVIISCAVTGAIHTPSMSPYLPITAQEISASALRAAEAGAAIVHLHARNPETGKPDQRPEAFRPIVQSIKQANNVVINLTSGGAQSMLVEERIRPAALLRPEVASLNMGSMNFGLFPMLNRFKEFKFDWEKAYLENSDDLIFRNTFRDIAYALRQCGEAGLSSNATILGIYIIWPISLIVAWLIRRFSYRAWLASWGVSVSILKM